MPEPGKVRLPDAEVEFYDGDGVRHQLRYFDSDHRYMLDGKRVVSVSTLAKVCYSDPGGLMHYAWKHGMNGVDYKEETKVAQEAGSAAHAQLEALAQTGKPLDLSEQPERVRGALQGVAKWWFDCEPTFLASEVMVCSPTLNYAGRFDFLAQVGDDIFIGDLKTTEAGKGWDHFARYKAPAAFFQLAGYGRAYSESCTDEPQPTRRAILRVGADGSYDWKPDLAPELSMAAFLSKVETYRADQTWAKAYKAAA
jgi:hypothetical protein